MPSALFTVRQLKALAGRAFERGERYFAEGRVTSMTVEADSVVGLVEGSAPYSVRVTPKFGMVVSRCSCPMEVACKHAVALGLAHIVERGSEEDVARIGPRDARAKAAAPDDGVAFETRAEVDAWAGAHHVRHVLELTAADLAPVLQGLDAWMAASIARMSLREIASRAGARRSFGASRTSERVAVAARALLEREAQHVRDGLAEEAAHAAAVAPGFAPLRARLAAVRAAVRGEGAFPRGRAGRAAGALRFDAATRELTWGEPAMVMRHAPVFGTVRIAARLGMTDAGHTLACTCNAPGGQCTHALALIDAALEQLAEPDPALDWRTIAEELQRPAWSRALAALDRLGAAPAAPPIEVWWTLEQALGTFTLAPIVRKLSKRGTLSAGARMSPERLLDAHGADLLPQDAQIAEGLVGWFPRPSGAPYPVRALAALVGHPRVVTDDDPDHPLTVARVPLGFTALESGDAIRVEPAVEGERLSPRLLAALVTAAGPSAPLVLLEPERHRCLLVDASPEARALWAALDQHGDAFPPEAHAALLDRLARFEGRLPIAVPAVLKGQELPAALVTVVRVRLLPDAALELELFIRPGPGAPLFAPGVGPRDVLLGRGADQPRAYVRRQLSEELAHARAAFARLPIDAADVEEGPPQCFRIGSSDAALALVPILAAPPPGLEAEWVDARPTVAPALEVKQLRVQIDVKRDWFGIVGEAKVEAGRIELAVLLDAARRQQRFVRLGEHRWIELSTTLRERLQGLADQTFTGRSGVELSPGAAAAVRELTAAGAEVTAAPAWEILTERLAASLALVPKPPAALRATLRDYQLDGHAWLRRIAAWGAGACLADDMGLGKTVQAIALLLDRAKAGPALVLAPTSVALNWVAELEKFAPTLRPIVYGAAADRAGVLAALKPRDVLIASYGLLVRDATALASREFATLIVDEAQALKNAQTRRARAARALRADFRVAMSGTPFENHLGELWSVFAVVFPGLFGSWEQFRERYATPIERGRDPRARAALSRVLRPFLLRRTKQEVARELPSRTEITVPIALSKDEHALYEDARLAAVAELTKSTVPDEQRRFQVLAALTRLRLLASHPKLYDPRSHVASSKLRRALELLEELRAEGHRALVFSQFTSHLALVREELARANFATLYLDGSTPQKERARLVAAFQAGEGDAFLISLKAGGTGINLTGADYVIHLDPWWNPASEDQATDRAHRIGQTKPVTVYRLVARGTIEEQILSLHGAKRALVAGILEGTDAAGRLSTKDLVKLLAAGEGPGDDA